MTKNIGVSVCVLRSILQQGNQLTCWFAPVRASRYQAGRTIFGACQLDSSSPDHDIRVQVSTAHPMSDDLLMFNTLGKLERSPLFLIDGGHDGEEQKILGPNDLLHLTAGSMGMVIPVQIRQDHRQALISRLANSGDMTAGLFRICACQRI